jgi:hypothetical protein
LQECCYKFRCNSSFPSRLQAKQSKLGFLFFAAAWGAFEYDNIGNVKQSALPFLRHAYFRSEEVAIPPPYLFLKEIAQSSR